jgi:hypothetical protein
MLTAPKPSTPRAALRVARATLPGRTLLGRVRRRDLFERLVQLAHARLAHVVEPRGRLRPLHFERGARVARRRSLLVQLRHFERQRVGALARLRETRGASPTRVRARRARPRRPPKTRQAPSASGAKLRAVRRPPKPPARAVRAAREAPRTPTPCVAARRRPRAGAQRPWRPARAARRGSRSRPRRRGAPPRAPRRLPTRRAARRRATLARLKLGELARAPLLDLAPLFGETRGVVRDDAHVALGALDLLLQAAARSPRARRARAPRALSRR